jgi:excisionase family DNA binding protein
MPKQSTVLEQILQILDERLPRRDDSGGAGVRVVKAEHASSVMTSTEACRELRISYPVLRRMIADGLLKATRIPGGSRYRIRRTDLEAARTATENAMPAAPPPPAPPVRKLRRESFRPGRG